MFYAAPAILSKIGIIIFGLSFTYYFIQLRNVRKLKPRSYSESYLDYLYKVREHFKAYKKFSDDMLYTMFPFFIIGYLLHIIGSFKTLLELVLRILMVIVIAIGMYFFQ